MLLVFSTIRMVLPISKIDCHSYNFTNWCCKLAIPFNTVDARNFVAPFVKCWRLHSTMCTAPLLAYPSFNCCCKDLQHFLILAENFKILGLTGGKTFLVRSKMESLYNLKKCQAPHLWMNIYHLSLFSTPVSFRWTIPYNSNAKVNVICQIGPTHSE